MNMTHTLGSIGLALGLAAAASPSWAADKSLPADQVVKAINAAVAFAPGQVKEVEVKEERGKLVVEVEVIGAKNDKREIKVDPGTGTVLNKPAPNK